MYIYIYVYIDIVAITLSESVRAALCLGLFFFFVCRFFYDENGELVMQGGDPEAPLQVAISPLGMFFYSNCLYKTQEDNKNIIGY